MEPSQLIGIVVSVVTICGALVAVGKWAGRRESTEANAKTSSRDAILSIRERVDGQDKKLDRIDGKLDIITALVVRVDQVEATVREVRATVAGHAERISKLEGADE